MRRGWACSIVVVMAVLAGGVMSAGASTTPTFSAVGGQVSAGRQVIIRYCNNQEARITEPAVLHGRDPAAVYVHGGSWVSGDYDTGGFIINRIGPALAARGFVVVSLDYRLGPRGRWPDQ